MEVVTEVQKLINSLRRIWRSFAIVYAISFLGLGPIALATWFAIRFEIATLWIVLFSTTSVVLLFFRVLLLSMDRGNLQLVAKWGFIELVVLVPLGVLELITRITWIGMPESFFRGYLDLTMAAMMSLSVAYLGFSRRLLSTTLKVSMDLALGPILTAWVLVSAVSGFCAVTESLRWVRQTSDHHATVRAARAARLAAWHGRPVAVTLSGGGYRAALIHAGLLSILDQAAIPISLLSTVSGGSITGATYAIGWTPTEFERFLGSERPGLPDDLFNVANFAMGLCLPSWTTGDTYAFNFDKVFFHGAMLSEIGAGGPTLLLNATNYETLDRSVFSLDNAAGERLAYLVAASGAFPIAFDPVMIGGARYSDGGLVENLGVEGLSVYLRAHPSIPSPGTVLISDASAEVKYAPRTHKPTILEEGTYALEAQFKALNKRIFALYSSGRYDRDSSVELQQPYHVGASNLWPHRGGDVAIFILSPTSPAERRRFGSRTDVVDSVARISTLHELTRCETEEAFWTGAALGRSYLATICAAAGVECKPVPTLPTPEHCQ